MNANYIMLLSLMLLASCGVGNKLVTKNVQVEKLGTHQDGILFITVYFRQREDGCEAYDLNARWTNGFIKQTETGDGEFACTVEGVNEKIEIYFEHPLIVSFEEYGENGELQRVEVSMKEAEHTFRINYGGGERLVKIYDRINQVAIGQFKIQ